MIADLLMDGCPEYHKWHWNRESQSSTLMMKQHNEQTAVNKFFILKRRITCRDQVRLDEWHLPYKSYQQLTSLEWPTWKEFVILLKVRLQTSSFQLEVENVKEDSLAADIHSRNIACRDVLRLHSQRFCM